MTIAKHPFVLFDERYSENKQAKCWEWTGAIGNHGYGWFHSNYSKRKWSELAHRASWMFHCGSIPDDLEICHKCDNTICVNPKHLFLGTHVDNMRDASIKKRFNDRRGTKNPRAILNDEKAYEIRWYDASGWSRKELSAEYGVSIPTIDKVLSQEIWRPEIHD